MLNDDDLDVRGAQLHHPADLTRLASFDQYRSLLLSIAYRMLGSVGDAEDMLQETFIRWQQARDDDIRSPRAFLVTIISRLCINHLQSARVKREEYVGQWLPEPLATDPRNNPFGIIKVDESLSLAFLLLLERLTPVERAVFLLREVFEYEYSQIADVVDQSEANCRQILRRARQHLSAVHPRFKPSAQEQNELLERFRQASASGDMDQLLALFSKDIVLHSDGGGKAIAVPNLVYGADRVARAIVRGFRKLLPTNLVQRILQVNGAPGVVMSRLTMMTTKTTTIGNFEAGMSSTRHSVKKDEVIYWTSTGIVFAIMLWSGLNFAFNPAMKGAFAHFGLPNWFRVELTTAKLLGAFALLLPGIPRWIKSFAYSGFAITLVSASVAHLSSGDPLTYVIGHSMFLVSLIISDLYYHKRIEGRLAL